MRRQTPALLAALCLTMSACNKPALRLEVERDTLVLYGDHPTLLPAKVIHENGRESHLYTPTIRRSDNRILSVGGSWVTCLQPGMATVSLSAKSETGSVVVDCRAIQAFHPASDIEMDVGDEPRALNAAVTLTSGDVVQLAPIEWTIHDPSVVSIDGNRVRPLALGYTSLKINYGGVVATTTVSVRHTLASGTLELKAGESREWDLPSGRYEIAVIVNSPADLTALRMETEGVQCSRNARNENLIHCLVSDRGNVTMSNTSAPPKARTSRAVVTILKTYSR